LPKKDPFHEEYGHHSSFRPNRRSGGEGLPVAKILLVVFVLAFAVLGYDRWRGRSGKAAPPPAVQAQAEGPPAGADSAPPELVERSADSPVIWVPTPSGVMQQRRAGDGEAPPSPPAADEEEKPPAFTVAEYVMLKNPRSNNFVGQGSINGKDVALLADTGASVVVVPERIAAQLGLKKGAAMVFSTGGGSVPHYATTIDSLVLGPIELRNVDAAINPAMQQDFVLLGMSALGVMNAQLEQGKLVLRYKQMATTAPEIAADEPFKRSSKDCVRRGNTFDQQALDCLKGR
jgi:clan AA aspartic protease (TIGR02281 family)